MRPVRNVFQKLSRTEQRREGVVAYLWGQAFLRSYNLAPRPSPPPPSPDSQLDPRHTGHTDGGGGGEEGRGVGRGAEPYERKKSLVLL